MHVCVFVFDLLMVDGEALIKHSLRERRLRIASALPKLRPGFIQVAEGLEVHVPQADDKDAGVKVTKTSLVCLSDDLWPQSA